MILETVAAVPGVVGGLLQHLRTLRHILDDKGWIRALLDDAGHRDRNHGFADALKHGDSPLGIGHVGTAE